MEWFKDQDYIYFNFSSLRWAWDIDKIVNVEISNDVVALLIREMQRLPTDMQLGLKVASCLGSCTKYASLDVISTGLGVNLRDLVDQVADKGFMVRVERPVFALPTTKSNRLHMR